MKIIGKDGDTYLIDIGGKFGGNDTMIIAVAIGGMVMFPVGLQGFLAMTPYVDFLPYLGKMTAESVLRKCKRVNRGYTEQAKRNRTDDKNLRYWDEAINKIVKYAGDSL